jgi:23S rRNA pseudouridine2605 synthase
MKDNYEKRQEKPNNRSGYGAGRDGKPFEKYNNNNSNRNNKLTFKKKGENSYSQGNEYKKPSNRPYRQGGGEYKSFSRPNNDDSQRKVPRPRIRKKIENGDSQNYIETRFDHHENNTKFVKKRPRTSDYDPNLKYSKKKQFEYQQQYVDPTKPVRLNKFLANSGICSRREADDYIQAGVISVNGEIVNQLGAKILPTDKVMFHNQPVQSEKKVYLLLNKPKDYITTVEDTKDRKTVMDLVKYACSERIYPVGRLDRNTTGVLLFTNDGDLASKLTHPKHDKKKIYHVTLDKALEKQDFEAVLAGVELDDGIIAADDLSFVKEDSLSQVGIEIHSGKNRVVRRIFEKLGYRVIRLDRVYFAGLTKKNLPRGKYRFLSQKEVNFLKMGSY